MAKSNKKKAATITSMKTKKDRARTSKLKPQAKKPIKKTTTSAGKAAKVADTKTKKPFKKEITERLLNAKEELLSEVTTKIKNESNSLKFEIGDIYDIASNERERELTLMLGDRDREKLADIEDALMRLDDGSYGLCDECGEPIAEGRLLALPFTKVCVDCKSREEKERGSRKRYEEESGIAIIEKTEGEEEEF